MIERMAKNKEKGEKNKRASLLRVAKCMKIALAAVLSIAVAGELGLEYSASAGIITVLSIQNTKRETFRSARNRGLAFLCALILGGSSYLLFGFTLPAFAIYLFCFAMLCFTMGWSEALAMDSVLITHFLTEQAFNGPMLINEIGLFLIGTTTGVLVNLHLHKREDAFKALADEVDQQFKSILHQMSDWLLQEDRDDYSFESFDKLRRIMQEAELCAVSNYNNAILSRSTYELDYITMREQQSAVLQGIYENIKKISYLPCQAQQIAALLASIEAGYHKDNTVEGLIEELETLMERMRQEPLPITREEFEARAILFYILKQLEELLHIKRDFIHLSKTPEV